MYLNVMKTKRLSYSILKMHIHTCLQLLRIELHRRKSTADALPIGHRVPVVLLDDHFAIGLLNGFPHFGLRHDLAHQILDGRLRIEIEKVAQRVVQTVERVRLWRMKGIGWMGSSGLQLKRLVGVKWLHVRVGAFAATS